MPELRPYIVETLVEDKLAYMNPNAKVFFEFEGVYHPVCHVAEDGFERVVLRVAKQPTLRLP